MPSPSLDLTDINNRLLRVANLADLAADPIKAAIDTVTAQVRATEQAELQSGGSGRVYPRGMRRFRADPSRNIRGGTAQAFHQASAPGEPPANDGGALLHSIRTSKAKTVRGGSLRGQVSASAFYAWFLESGTRKMFPRPFAVPAADAHQQDFVEAVTAAINAAVALTNEQI